MRDSQAYAVAVIDDDAGLRGALSWLMAQHGYGAVEYPDGESFLRCHDPSRLGCMLIDLRLGDIDGIALHRLAQQRGHDAPAIMISAFGDIPHAVAAAKSGVFGFLEKPLDNEQLLQMVEQACRLHRELRARYGSRATAASLVAKLTQREAEVFRLLADGFATKEIAAMLSISHRTAEVHRARVFQKLKADSLATLIRVARALPA